MNQPNDMHTALKKSTSWASHVERRTRLAYMSKRTTRLSRLQAKWFDRIRPLGGGYGPKNRWRPTTASDNKQLNNHHTSPFPILPMVGGPKPMDGMPYPWGDNGGSLGPPRIFLGVIGA